MCLFCVVHREISPVRKQPLIISTCSRFPFRVCRSWRESGCRKWLWSDWWKTLIWVARSPSPKVHETLTFQQIRDVLKCHWFDCLQVLQLFSALFLMFCMQCLFQMARSGKSHSGGSWILYRRKRETKVCIWFLDICHHAHLEVKAASWPREIMVRSDFFCKMCLLLYNELNILMRYRNALRV